MYVAAWAGSDVEKVKMHAPFNLCLRLLIELCDCVVIPMSNAETFDESKKPFQSGEGITEDFAVQEQTSSTTAVEVCFESGILFPSYHNTRLHNKKRSQPYCKQRERSIHYMA